MVRAAWRDMVRFGLTVGVVCLGLLVVVVALVGGAEAVHGGGSQEAFSFTEAEGTAGAVRCWYVTAASVGLNDTCETAFDTATDLVPGQTVEVRYHTATEGALPPAEATNVVIEVREPIGDTLVDTLHSGAPPANQATFNWTASEAGEYEIFLEVENDQIGSYMHDSREQGFGTAGFWRTGFNVTTFEFSDNGLPAFAVGQNCDESITLTIDGTSPTIDGTNTAGIGWVAGGDELEFNVAASQVGIVLEQTAQVTEANFGDESRRTWTGTLFSFDAGHFFSEWTFVNDFGPSTDASPSYVAQNDTAVIDTRTFIDSVGSVPPDGSFTEEFDVINRGEGNDISFALFDGNDDQLLCTMDLSVGPPSQTVDSFSDSGPTYEFTYTPGGNDPAAHNTSGLDYTVRWSEPSSRFDNRTTSGQDGTFGVSSLFFLDVHVEGDNMLTQDHRPSPDANEVLTFIAGQEVMHFWVHVDGVRLDRHINTGANDVSFELVDSNGNTQSSQTTGTQNDGWTPQLNSVAAIPPTGLWVATGNASFQGNTGEDVEAITITSPFTGDKVLRVTHDAPLAPGSNVTFWVRAIQANTSAPDTPPVLAVGRGQFNPPMGVPEWQDVVFLDTLNVQNWTNTVNGTLYLANWSIPDTVEPGVYSILVRSQFAGTEVYETANAEVENVIEIAGMDSSALIELAIWSGFFLLGAWRGWTLVAVVATMAIWGPLVVSAGGSWPIDFKAGVALMLFALWGSFLASGFQGLRRWVFFGAGRREDQESGR